MYYYAIDFCVSIPWVLCERSIFILFSLNDKALLVKTKFICIHENMDNQNHCMSIKQARLIVNAHKHNLLKSFCNNEYACLYF